MRYFDHVLGTLDTLTYAWDGPVPSEEEPVPVKHEPPAKWFVTWVTDARMGSVARVSEFDDSPTGREQLASLVRGVTVLAVVLGHRAAVDARAVTDLSVGDRTVLSSIPLTS